MRAYTSPVQPTLRVDTAGVQAMASRWGASVDDIKVVASPAESGLSCQLSAAAVSAAHGEVTAFTAALATRVGTHAAHAAEADARYIANESRSADQLAAVAHQVTSL